MHLFRSPWLRSMSHPARTASFAGSHGFARRLARLVASHEAPDADALVNMPMLSAAPATVVMPHLDAGQPRSAAA